MTSQPIPKTMPRSTLACPPPNNFRDQVKSNLGTESQARLSSQFRDSQADKKISRNDSEERGALGIKSNAQIIKDGFGSSSTNFRASSKDAKGQQSTKNLASNSSNFATLAKKQKQDTA